MAEPVAFDLPARLEPADLAGLGVLVAGLRVAGRSVALRLATFGADVVTCDDAEIDAAELEAAGVRVHTGGSPAELLEGRQLLVVAPGLRERHPLIQAALGAGVPVWSEVELGARLARAPMVGVTGTNGKSTTAELAAAMLAASGRRTVAAGNLGLPLIDAVLARQAPEALVVELSSFQLRFCHRLHLVAGAWLNLAPDHLDWHGDLTAYAAAKARVWANQTPSDWSLYAADDPVVASHAAHAPGNPVPFGVGRVPPGGLGVEAGIALSRIEGHEGPLWRAAALRLPGRHNLANALAASGLALALGAHPAAMTRAVAAFRASAHRMATLARVRGVTFVDDSKATNPHAAGRALEAFQRVVWIAGGRNKGLAFDELVADVRSRLVGAVLIGEAAGELAAALERDGYGGPVVRATSMGEAVTVAFSLAEPGDTVLLAPACASFDMFSSYAERGEAFAASVARLAERQEGGVRRAPP
ncbi:MAG TPA: UDP-N-acetylmuramoyl-L-alanine--D-glutamate ligase [Actinomycetota bacterium]|nr:UDP-N-acetylmuramoyl-L-alanine--D-glutamate ligase [Actinomycetota bacterium]